MFYSPGNAADNEQLRRAVRELQRDVAEIQADMAHKNTTGESKQQISHTVTVSRLTTCRNWAWSNSSNTCRKCDIPL